MRGARKSWDTQHLWAHDAQNSWDLRRFWRHGAQKPRDSQHFHKTILQKIMGLSECSGTRRANTLRLTAFVGAWGARSWELQHFWVHDAKIRGFTAFRCMMHKKPVTHCVFGCVVHNNPGTDGIFWCGVQKFWALLSAWCAKILGFTVF